MFKRNYNFIENDLQEIIIHKIEDIFVCRHIIINMEYNPRNISNV